MSKAPRPRADGTRGNGLVSYTISTILSVYLGYCDKCIAGIPSRRCGKTKTPRAIAHPEFTVITIIYTLVGRVTGRTASTTNLRCKPHACETAFKHLDILLWSKDEKKKKYARKTEHLYYRDHNIL